MGDNEQPEHQIKFNLLSWMRARLRDRADSEHEQAIVRLIIGLVIFAYLMSPLPALWDKDASVEAPRLVIGVFLALSPGSLGIALVVFGLVVGIWRWVSLGSVLASVALAPAALLLGEDHSIIAAAALTGVLAIWKHRSNIQKLIAGTEDKLGEKDDEDHEQP